MNVGRMLALVFAVSLTLCALSGTLDRAAAQGPAVDTPSGYALTPASGDAETGAPESFIRGLRFVPRGYSPFLPGFLAWVPVKSAAVASSRVAAVAATRRPVLGPASRQRVGPGGR